MKSEETKRLIVAFAITFLIVVLWRPIMTRFFGPEAAPEPAVTPSASGSANSSPTSPPAAASVPAASQPPPAPVSPPVQGRQTQQIVVENAVYRVTLSTQGAVVKSWILKKYRDANDKPLDLVSQDACQQLGFPISVSLSDAGLAGKLNAAVYRVDGGGRETIQAPARLKFTYSDGQTQVQKSFSFGDSYQIDASVSAFDSRGYLPVGVLWPGGFGDYSLGPKTMSANSQAVYKTNGDLTTVKESKLKGTETASGSIGYAGLEDLYFIDIFLPRSPQVVFRVSHRPWTPANWTEKELPSPLQAELASAGGGQPLEFGLVLAPKDLDLLRAMKPPLDDLVSFGVFSVLAKPLFLAMRYIYDHWVHNYGWAIIILTVIINFALFPLKLRSIHSAQKMQRVAPRVKRIQDQYKQYKLNDPRKQKMNEEVMKLYKEEGINPVGGCLPMVLQLPFLYAIYEVLGTVIEMRHAPWLGCIKDLAAPDSCHPFGIPFPLLPTLMIISMFVMQKMTPMATTDPNQQRMMYIMPLVFGVIFYRLASGLVLYYMAANLVGIAQQLIINRFIPVAAPGGGPPPADAKGTGEKTPKTMNRPASRKPVSVKN